MTTRRITSPEQDRIVYEHFHKKGLGGYKLVQEFLLEHFGISLTLAQVRTYLHNRKITLGVNTCFKKGHISPNKGKKMPKEIYEKCSRTMFKKGLIPHNHRDIGSTRIIKDGYIEIKVAEPNKWKSLQRVIWEENTGEQLKRTEIIIFLDGNKQNCNFENLAKINRSQLARLNQNHLLSDIPDISKVGITLAKLLELKAKRSKR